MKILLYFLIISTSIIAQTAYTDNFNSAPFSGNPTSFTTGSPSAGLSYNGTNCDFGWDLGEINAAAIQGVSASVTITSRDGKAFYFNSIKIEPSYGSITITGSGVESFTINLSGGSPYISRSPSGGSKLVTQVTIASVVPHDFWVYIDDLSTTLGYSLITFNDGNSFTQSITSNSTNQVIGRFYLDADYSGAQLTSATINFEGTPTGISNFKLWSSNDANFGGDTQIGSTIANYPGNGGSINFTGFSNSVSSSGTYYFLTVDVAANPTGTVRAYVTSKSSLTLSSDGYLNSTFSNSYLSSEASPLPVELTSFTANVNNGKVKLSWETATEVNNYGFEIQKLEVRSQKSEEVVWEKVGFVEGSGNSNSPKEYSFLDEAVPNGKYSYRLKQIDFDGQFEYLDVVEVEVNVLPAEFSLSQNYPNPFNPSTSIEYTVVSSEYVSLIVYDVLGNEVKTLVNEKKDAGSYRVNFDATSLSSGVYFYKIQAGSFNQVRKMMLLR